MPLSQISLPVRSEGPADVTDKGATTKSKTKPVKPIEAFDDQTLRDFEMLLENDKSCPALNAHERSHLRTIL